jgi:hypothetical protein
LPRISTVHCRFSFVHTSHVLPLFPDRFLLANFYPSCLEHLGAPDLVIKKKEEKKKTNNKGKKKSHGAESKNKSKRRKV